MELDFDETPDSGLPVRILQAFRVRCDEKENTSGLDLPAGAWLRSQLARAENQNQDQRAAIVDDAIQTLEAVG